MNEIKSFRGIFIKIYPVFSLLFGVIIFSLVFDTFDHALNIALYNVLLMLPVYGLCLMVARKYQSALIIMSIASFALYYLDQYVFSSRLTHIRFSDFHLITQAARVADRYSLIWNSEITRRFVLAAALCILFEYIYRYYQLHYSKKSVFLVGLTIFMLSSVLVFSGFIPSEKDGFDFNTETEQRGLLYSWYCQAKESTMKIPDGYNKDNAEYILECYIPEANKGGDVNVIVIMNESLSDYSLIGVPRFDDPLPYIHSLDKNSFEGKLVVDVFGGGTANTEYSFLTGNTLAFLPKGSTPYLQYVDQSTENFASELSSLGYNKIAIHPYFSEEWNRSQVYRFFGFDQFISGEDFGTGIETGGQSATAKVTDNLIRFGDGPLYVRGLISDQTSYERVLDALRERSFIFNVTMQNHGGYSYPGQDFISTEFVTEFVRTEWTGNRTLNGMLYEIDSSDLTEEIAKVNQYLTCANLSDQAFQYLLGELEKSDQKTIVLMFGDHQPGLLISEHYVDVDEGVDLDYTVPYILWANYDIEFDAPEITSPNYLSAILKKNAGLPLTAWDQFRLDMMEKYPVLTSNYILNDNGEIVSKDVLYEYEIVQYMRMFG